MTDMQEAIGQIQFIEQNLQHLMVQKQSLQTQLIEYESALEELSEDAPAWKLIGNIMVKADAPTLRQEMEQKKKSAESRIQAFEQQEKKLREKAQSLQKRVMEQMHEQD